MGLFCSRVCPGSVTVNGVRYRVVRDLGEGGKSDELVQLIQLHDSRSSMILSFH